MTVSYKIGLISDTHDDLPLAVGEIFAGVDAIIHAGDVGNNTVIKKLEDIAPVTAVRGNCDYGLVAAFLEDVEFVKFAGVHFAVMHKLSQAEHALPKDFKGVVVFGHTHNPEQFRNAGLLFINPGSPSYPRVLIRGTVAVLTITGNEPPQAVFYEIDADEL